MESELTASAPIKGAFKHFPLNQQPKRVPLEIYDQLAQQVVGCMGDLAETFVPSGQKSVGKSDTGDMDVIVNPYNRNTWKADFEERFKKYIVAKISNGPQLMCVMKDLIGDGNQYMIDFILAKENSFDYRKKYSKFGTIIPAVVGSFARSLRYKFDQNQLALRMLSAKGNYHNIPLTSDFSTTLKILMLDPVPFDNDKLYEPEQVANWVTSSPRFDSDTWRKPPNPDGQTIVTKNKKSHRAIKQKPIVQTAYTLIDSTEKKATWDNSDYKIERELLGSLFIDNVIARVNEIEKKEDKVITGNDIIKHLGVKPGPEVGKILSYISIKGLNREQAFDYLDSLNK